MLGHVNTWSVCKIDPNGNIEQIISTRENRHDAYNDLSSLLELNPNLQMKGSYMSMDFDIVNKKTKSMYTVYEGILAVEVVEEWIVCEIDPDLWLNHNCVKLKTRLSTWARPEAARKAYDSVRIAMNTLAVGCKEGFSVCRAEGQRFYSVIKVCRVNKEANNQEGKSKKFRHNKPVKTISQNGND
jgi:hypothetical protein